MNWYLLAFQKYAVFSGRATRTEYWMFALFNILAGIVLGFADYFTGLISEQGFGAFSTVYSLIVLVPSLALSVRRLHDTGRSGWWLLIVLIPVVGALVLFVFTLLDSEPVDNLYGPNPKPLSRAF